MKKFHKRLVSVILCFFCCVLCMIGGAACVENSGESSNSGSINSGSDSSGNNSSGNNSSGSDNSETPKENEFLTLVDPCDVPDAYVGYPYDLKSILREEKEGVSYSVKAYTFSEDGKKQIIPTSNMKFTPTKVNTYAYAVFSATYNGKEENSEEVRIRCMQPVDGFMISRKDVPDAITGVVYDLSVLTVAKEGVTYSAVAYTKEGNVTQDLTVTDMKITPTVENAYVYTVITATKDGMAVQSEEYRIRCFKGLDKDFLVEEAYYPTYKLGEKCYLTDIIYAQRGVSYTAVAYYGEGETKEDIPVGEDLSFVPTKKGEDVNVVITATKGEESVSTAVISLEILGEEDEKDLKLKWSYWYSTFNKSINIDPSFVKVGTSSVKVDYSGVRPGNYYTLGVFDGGYFARCDVSNWENAVISFWVYNDSDAILEVAVDIVHHKSGNDLVNMLVAEIPARSWKQVNFSLRVLGITSEFFYNPEYAYRYGSSTEEYLSLDRMTLKSHYKGLSDWVRHDETFYIDDFNVYDYDSELFPDVETRTQDEIMADEGLDKDAYLGDTIVPAASAVSSSFKADSVYTQVKFGAANIPQKPETSETDLSMVQFNSKYAPENTSYTVNGIAFKFENAFNERLTQGTVDYTKSTAVMEFWLYTKPSVETEVMRMYLLDENADVSKRSNVAKIDQAGWTKVRLPLSDFATAITAKDFTLYLCYSYDNIPKPTSNFSEYFYIDEFKIYNMEEVTLTKNELLAQNKIVHGMTVNKLYSKSLTNNEVVKYADMSVSAPEGVESDTAIKYTITAFAPIANYYAAPIVFNAPDYEMDARLKAMFSVTDWTNAYLGFWVYNDSDRAMSILPPADNYNYWGGTAIKLESRTWTYVEFSLKDVYGIESDVFTKGGMYNMKVFVKYSGGAYTSADTYQDFKGEFYIDGFDIYNK